VATSFEAPTTPLGFDELTIAGGLRGRPVELVDCVTQPTKSIAPRRTGAGRRIPAGRPSGMRTPSPASAGPCRSSRATLARRRKTWPFFTVTGITHRVDPILQILVGPGEEHVTLTGLPTETSIYRLINDAIPGLLQERLLRLLGGGKYLAILQVKSAKVHDEGMQRQAALVAFTAFFELKHGDRGGRRHRHLHMNDVMWAMTTRYQGDIDTVFIPAIRGHALALQPRWSSIRCCGTRHHLQDHLRLHGALGTGRTVHPVAVHGRGPEQVRHQVKRVRRRADGARSQ